MSLNPFGRRWRNLGRLGHVARVLTKHGFGWLAVRLHLDRFVPFRRRLLGHRLGTDEAVGPSMAARVARVMEELGPTYVKLGQVLGSRADLMPPAFVEEFRKLVDRVRPFPTEDARAEIVRQLGGPVEQFFDDFGAQPFAAGSIGQAYYARTKDGRPVVVKVRRPGIRDLLEADIDILTRLAELADRYVPEYRVLRPVVMVEEFATTVRREIDFIAEASNTERFREALADSPNVRVPHVLWNLTGSGVLTLERLDGVPIYDAAAMAAAGADRKALAAALTDCFLRQYFEMGLFHADPHAGNLIVQAPNVLGILDFGQVGRMSDTMRARLGTALVAALRRDFDIVLDVFDDLDALPDEVDGDRLKADLAGLVDKFSGIPLKRLRVKDVFEEITSVTRRHRVLLPRDFVLLGKSLVTMGGVALDLDPEVSIVEIVRPRIRSLVAEKLSPKRLVQQGMTSAYHLMSLAEQGPRSLRQLARKIMRGRLQIVFRHDNLDRFITELDRSSNRIAFAVIVASIIMGSAWLMQTHVKPLIPGTDTPLLGTLGFIVAGLLGIWLVVAILRSGRL
jgi:ubiquinone biosynthesis protein